MNSIYELIKKGEALQKKTAKLSISPVEVGGLITDTLKYLYEVEQNSIALSIRKSYTSISAMNADSDLIDDFGKKLKRGQLVVIISSDQDADNGKVYMYRQPGFQYINKISEISVLQRSVEQAEEFLTEVRSRFPVILRLELHRQNPTCFKINQINPLSDTSNVSIKLMRLIKKTGYQYPAGVIKRHTSRRWVQPDEGQRDSGFLSSHSGYSFLPVISEFVYKTDLFFDLSETRTSAGSETVFNADSLHRMFSLIDDETGDYRILAGSQTKKITFKKSDYGIIKQRFGLAVFRGGMQLSNIAEFDLFIEAWKVNTTFESRPGILIR